MRINLITGGSGFVGRHLVKRLLESGENVWILMRPFEGTSTKERAEKLFANYFKEFSSTFRVVEGDIMKQDLGIAPSDLKELSSENIFLWHLAANLSFSSKSKDEVWRTNYIGTINTINLANKLAQKYIYVSTAYVCGDTRAVFYEEDLDVGQKFRNYYESSKFEAERSVRNNCNVPYLIFRPSIIMGDAYEGKADGCTFGYYRFAYIFFIFKKWLIDKTLNSSFLTKNILALLGTRYDKKNSVLIAPWLILPYPSHGTVDMVSIDYVIESMLRVVGVPLHEQKLTIHLTNPNPPPLKFALSSLIEDLGYQKVKYIKIPAGIFKGALYIFNYIFFPLRVKIRSAMWYLPYITRRYHFSHKNNQIIGLAEPAFITRDFLNKINTYAQKEIFKNIDIEGPL